jgi:hypothetical protein
MLRLRLSNYSTAGARAAQQVYIDTHCRWRGNPSAQSTATATGTGTSTGTTTNTTGTTGT